MFDAGRALAVSPDGQQVVYLVGGTLVGGGSLMVRGVDQLDARPLAGVDFVLQPFFSPDSRWIGFFSSPGATTGWVLAKVSTTGGPAVTLCSIKGKPLGASWGDDNTIVLATDEPGTGLWQVPAGGGEPTVLTTPDATQGELLAAFVVPKPGATLRREELAAHCRALASRYKVPDFIEIRDTLPVTVTGKLMRRELKQIAASLARSAAS